MRFASVAVAAVAGLLLLAGSTSAAPSQVSISIGDAQAAEGNAGTRPLVLGLTLSEASRASVFVSWRTRAGAATSPEDYVTASGLVQFAPGETQKTVQVLINGDTKLEPDETFFVDLSDPVGAVIARGTATGTIQNDDQEVSQPPPQQRVVCKCKRVKTRLAGFNAHGSTTLVGKLTGKKEAAEFWDFVVKAELTCRLGDIVDCEGFVKTESPSTFPPFATQKPKLFKCKGKKCGEKRTFTLEVRIRVSRQEILDARKAKKPLKKKLRLRSGCRGERGELRAFTLVFTNGNAFSKPLSDQNGNGRPDAQD